LGLPTYEANVVQLRVFAGVLESKVEDKDEGPHQISGRAFNRLSSQFSGREISKIWEEMIESELVTNTVL
jgi:hypothetical protein